MITSAQSILHHLASCIARALPKRATLTLVLALTLLCPALAFAADKVTLRDGRVLEGTILREEQGYIWFQTTVGAITRTDIFSPAEILALERSTAAETPGTTPAAATPQPSAAQPAAADRPRPRSGAIRAAVITLGAGPQRGMVGIYLTADSLRRAIPLLKEENVELVVFRVNSPGGIAAEVQPLSDVIQNEYKPNFTVVAWIESAISAAAMTAHTIENIYFMSTGNYGAATAYVPDGQGGGTAASGRALETFLYTMERISARGGHPKQIMRSMQIMEPLSVSFDENGQATWFNTTEGQFIVNPPDRVLTLNAEDAVRFKFARGIADDIHQLAKVMGYPEVEWVGEAVPGVPYPVSKAEAFLRRFRDQTNEDERRLREYQVLYQQAIQLAQGLPPEQRGPLIGQARRQLENIKRMVRNNPNFAEFIFGRNPEQWREFIEEQEEILRRLSRR